MNAILLLALLASITDPVPPPAWLAVREPVPPPIEATDGHSGQPITVPKDVPFDRRLPGPTNWFRCPHCGRADCWMFLAEHLLKDHRVSRADLETIGWRNFGVFHDNLENVNWKPSVPTVKQSGCEGGNCQPARPARGLRRWR